MKGFGLNAEARQFVRDALVFSPNKVVGAAAAEPPQGPFVANGSRPTVAELLMHPFLTGA